MKRIAAVLLSLILLTAAVPWNATAATTGRVGNITYEINDGQVTLTGYVTALPANLVIPEAVGGYPVTTIGYKAFEDAAISSVTIPDSVTKIEDYAFAWCTFLKTATVGNGVASIGYGTFSYTGLISITIGSGARSISEYAFMSCDNLTAVAVAQDNPYYCSVDGVLFDKAVTQLVYYPGGKTGAYTIPDGVTGWGNCAFDFCETITSLTLPASFVSFPTGSLYRCRTLGAVHVAEDNPYLCSRGGVVFTKDMSTLLLCPSGRRGMYVLPEQVTTVAKSAFEHCEYLTSIIIPKGVTAIGDSAFAYCHKLTAMTIPDSVTEIGEGLFYDCDNLASVTIGNGVTRLSSMALYGCPKLSDIHLPDGLTYIGYGAFSGTAYESTAANWTGSLLYYGTYLVGVKENYIGKCVVRDGTTVIGEYVFHDCTKLTSVVIPEGVKAIEFSTFGGCEALTSVTLPRSLTTVGEYAFSRSPLTDVYYGGTEKDRAAITVEKYNDALETATWHYTKPAAIPGDVNGDGKVNNRDLGVLQQYLNEWDVAIDSEAADLNGDGKVNNRDLGLLQLLLNQ